MPQSLYILRLSLSNKASDHGEALVCFLLKPGFVRPYLQKFAVISVFFGKFGSISLAPNRNQSEGVIILDQLIRSSELTGIFVVSVPKASAKAWCSTLSLDQKRLSWALIVLRNLILVGLILVA